MYLVLLKCKKNKLKYIFCYLCRKNLKIWDRKKSLLLINKNKIMKLYSLKLKQLETVYYC